MLIKCLVLIFMNLTFAYSESVNVGTTLFKKDDACKKCWTADDKNLLTARRNMQNILPIPDLVDFHHEHAFTSIRDYFYMSLEAVKKRKSDPLQNTYLRAATDAIGGYLKSFILPVVKAAFYSGRATYEETSDLYNMLKNFKEFLNTDGSGWKCPPEGFGVKFEVKPLVVLEPDDRNSACDDLILQDDKCNNTIIPLPVFDRKENPQVLGLPVKKNSIVSVYSPTCPYLLMKFYISVIHCMASLRTSHDKMVKYNSELYQWIKTEVIPILQKEEVLPPFGGVLRILEGIKSSGVDSNITEILPNYDFLFPNTVNVGKNGVEGGKLDINYVIEHQHPYVKKLFDKLGLSAITKSHTLLAIFFLVPIILVIALCYLLLCCWKVRKESRHSADRNYQRQLIEKGICRCSRGEGSISKTYEDINVGKPQISNYENDYVIARQDDKNWQNETKMMNIGIYPFPLEWSPRLSKEFGKEDVRRSGRPTGSFRLPSLKSTPSFKEAEYQSVPLMPVSKPTSSHMLNQSDLRKPFGSSFFGENLKKKVSASGDGWARCPSYPHWRGEGLEGDDPCSTDEEMFSQTLKLLDKSERFKSFLRKIRRFQFIPYARGTRNNIRSRNDGLFSQ